MGLIPEADRLVALAKETILFVWFLDRLPLSLVSWMTQRSCDKEDLKKIDLASFFRWES